MITVNETTHIPAHGSLLESLEKAGIPVESQCRKGFCGACRTKLIEGDVEYIHEPLGFTQKGEVLACCCKAKTDLSIEVKLIA